MRLDEPEAGEMTLRGIVVPVDWDPHGVVRTVAILTPDEGEYEVLPNGAGARLAMHPRCEVLVRAVAIEPEGAGRRVRISSFAILEWEDDDDHEIPDHDDSRGQRAGRAHDGANHATNRKG